MTTWPQVSIDVAEGYTMCFGCGQDNPIGLKLNFQWDGKTARAEFTPTEFYQSWPGLVHGGIIICILDEAMGWVVLFEGLNCVTAEIQVKLKRPASLNEPLVITSSITKKTRKLVKTKAAVSLKDGTLVAEGTATQYVADSPNSEGSTGSEQKAVIWDMDGVIADSAAHHLKAWQEAFSKRGVNFTEEDFRHDFGQRNDNIIKHTLGEQISRSEIEAIAAEKGNRFRSLVRQGIKPLPGAIELISSLGEKGFKLAIASSGPIENIELVTQSLGVYNYFDTIVSGHDVSESKPSPQVFLRAAQKLGVKPKNCIVVEDAVAGVTAAKRGGMHCLAVTNTHPSTSLAEADLVVDTLETVTVDDLERLLVD